MKNKVLTLVALSALILMWGCGKNCRDASCPTVVPAFFAFRLTNSADKDLLAGPAKLYDTSQVRIRAKRNTGSIEAVNRVFTQSGDTLVLTGFNVSQDFSVYYLQLNGVTTDSLYFQYNKSVTDCCDLSNFTFNRFNTTSITPARLPASFVIKK